MSTHAETIHERARPPTNVSFEEGQEISTSSTRALALRERAAERIDTAARNGQLANALGWFSIALGTVQLIAPRQLARAIGVPENAGLMRSLGLREIASGVAILSSPQWAGLALKARVAGDVMDLALIGAAMTRGEREPRSRAAAATFAVAGVTALDVLAARLYDEAEASADNIIDIRKSIAINMPPDALYEAWNDFESFPTIMRHLESVHVLDNGRSHWVARAPAGMRVEWESEQIANERNELIAWRSLPGSQIENMGAVRFESLRGRRGTLLTVELEYRPPAGRFGAVIAKLFGEEPEVQLHEDLRRFKQVMETGEIATTRSQPSGTRSLKYRLMSQKEPAHAR